MLDRSRIDAVLTVDVTQCAILCGYSASLDHDARWGNKSFVPWRLRTREARHSKVCMYRRPASDVLGYVRGASSIGIIWDMADMCPDVVSVSAYVHRTRSARMLRWAGRVECVGLAVSVDVYTDRHPASDRR